MARIVQVHHRPSKRRRNARWPPRAAGG